MTPNITDIHATVIQDSRGRDTIAVSVHAGDHAGTFAVPSGASTGTREAVVRTPADAESIIKERVLPALQGVAVTEQHTIDQILHDIDATENFASIGGNVAIGISVAALKTSADVLQEVLHERIRNLCGDCDTPHSYPHLFINCINGGLHASAGSDIQEHQIVVSAEDIITALQQARAVEVALKAELEAVYGSEQVTRGDEGGFVVPSHTTEAPFAHIMVALEHAGLSDVSLGIDAAASSFYRDGVYTLNAAQYATEELLAAYAELHAQFPTLRFVEDPFREDDSASFQAYQRAQQDVTVIGDDLTTTNAQTVREAAQEGAITGVIIKPNQIGTLTDTLSTIATAHECGIKTVVSHRSGETMDDFIADLVVGAGCFGLKAGMPSAPERGVKYERLAAILTS